MSPGPLVPDRRGADLISVVIAAYNAEGTIAETLVSLIGQTHGNIEIIVCNDASTDGTGRVIKSFDDKRLVVVTNDINLGPGESRDRAISQASGRWIAMVDADDICHPDRFRRLLNATAGDASVVVFDNQIECHHTKYGLRPWRPVYNKRAFGSEPASWVDVSIADWLLSDRRIMHPLVPADIIRQYAIRHTSRRFAEDSEFVLNVLSKGMTLRYLSEPLYYYRITPGSLTASPQRWSGVCEIFERAVALFPSDPQTQAALMRAASNAKRLAEYQCFAHDIRSLQLGKAMRCVGSSPWLARMFVRRAAVDVMYHLDRTWRRGSTRS